MLSRPLPIVLALAAALAVAPAAAAEQRELELLSTFGEGRFAELSEVSDDGARVFVTTDAPLSPGDTDSSADVYLRTANAHRRRYGRRTGSLPLDGGA